MTTLAFACSVKGRLPIGINGGSLDGEFELESIEFFNGVEEDEIEEEFNAMDEVHDDSNPVVIIVGVALVLLASPLSVNHVLGDGVFA